MRPQTTNNIGVLRLLFASLVIVGHAPEMVDGDRSRESLTMLFHTLSLGELSVDAFFLLSGYLITKSMMQTGRLLPFLERRVLRIVPAFAVAYLLSVFVLGPLVGSQIWGDLTRTIVRFVLLREPPAYDGQFPGLQTYPLLNGSLWTISHEFHCYLLVALLSVVGLLRHRWAVLALTVVLLAVAVLATFPILADPLTRLYDMSAVRLLVGSPQAVVRLTPIFMVGACWFLFEAEMERRATAGVAFACALICCALLYHDPHFAELGLTLFGGLALYWISFKAEIGRLQIINRRWDISYGTYLYGWPIAIYLVWRFPSISPWIVASVALPLAILAGAASWWGLEKWTKDLVRSKSQSRAPEAYQEGFSQRTDQRRARALLTREK